ncbi:MAG: hypothetical protein ACXAAO_11940 [Candidatus Thorarchaeota archaeon]
MRTNRIWIENRIMMILDESPCHGYELQQALPEEARKVKLTTGSTSIPTGGAG